MKTFKLILFLGSVFAISSAFFACSDPPVADPAAVAPGLTFKTPENKPSVQVDRYEQIKFNFTATSNLSTKKDLKSIKMVASYTLGGATETLIDSTFPEKTSKTIEYVYTVKPKAPWGQKITIQVTVNDVDLKQTSKSFSYIVTDLSDLYYYDSITMGAQNNATVGSYFATETGNVWLKGTAVSNKTKVDFIYFFNDQTGDAHCIAAPGCQQIADNTSLVQGWTIAERNKTEFKKVFMSDDGEFDRIRSSDSISKKYLGGSTVFYIPTITGGGSVSTSYIVFKTVKGKYGLIKVDDINELPDQTKSSVILSVKVQK